MQGGGGEEGGAGRGAEYEFSGVRGSFPSHFAVAQGFVRNKGKCEREVSEVLGLTCERHYIHLIAPVASNYNNKCFPPLCKSVDIIYLPSFPHLSFQAPPPSLIALPFPPKSPLLCSLSSPHSLPLFTSSLCFSFSGASLEGRVILSRSGAS